MSPQEKPFLSDDMTMRLKTMLEMANTISEMTKMPLLYTGSVTLLPRKSIIGAMMPLHRGQNDDFRPLTLYLGGEGAWGAGTNM
jgi:hypothetical protein